MDTDEAALKISKAKSTKAEKPALTLAVGVEEAVGRVAGRGRHGQRVCVPRRRRLRLQLLLSKASRPGARDGLRRRVRPALLPASLALAAVAARRAAAAAGTPHGQRQAAKVVALTERGRRLQRGRHGGVCTGGAARAGACDVARFGRAAADDAARVGSPCSAPRALPARFWGCACGLLLGQGAGSRGLGWLPEVGQGAAAALHWGALAGAATMTGCCSGDAQRMGTRGEACGSHEGEPALAGSKGSSCPCSRRA